MAYYRKRRRTFKRRPYRRRRYYRRKRFRSNQLTVRRPFPTKYLFKTRYVQHSIPLDAQTFTPGTYFFNLSSLYDPNVSGTGHQVIGFDELMQAYEHYTVIGARIKIDFVNTSNTHAQRCYAYLQASTTPPANLTKIQENGLCKSVILDETSAGDPHKTMYINVSHKKFFGTKDILGEHNFRGTATLGPIECVYLGLTNTNVDVNQDPAPVAVDIEINFVAVLSEPKMLGQS